MLPSRALMRQILQLAAPTTALSMLQVLAQLVETVLAARQGTAALAGWAVLLPFALLLAQMSTGAMGGGVVAAVARALGGQRRDEASALVLHAMLIATAFGAVFAVGLLIGAGPLLRGVAGIEAEQAAWAYAAWLFGLGAIPAWWTNTLASVLRGGGQHALAARVLGLQWAALPVAAWLLAEPAGLGLAGLGLAFALSNLVAAAALLRVVRQGRAGFHPAWRGRPTRALFVQILAVGAVASGLATLANLTTVIVTAQLRHLGPAMVAAYVIAARLEFLVIPLAWGVGSALTALVGRQVGAGDWASARRTAWRGRRGPGRADVGRLVHARRLGGRPGGPGPALHRAYGRRCGGCHGRPLADIPCNDARPATGRQTAQFQREKVRAILATWPGARGRPDRG